MDMIPHYNNDVVLYIDDWTGTNVVFQPRTHGTGKSAVTEEGTGTASASRPTARVGQTAAAPFENNNNPQRSAAHPTRAGEKDDLLPGGKRDVNRNIPERHADDSVSTSRFPRPRFPFDVNIYQQKKTLAQGMMDLALISANANQFRYVLQSSHHPYYITSLGMIGTSLFLQIIVGIGLIWNSKYNVKKDNDVIPADKINNLTIIGIFLVTILNVFITSFGVVEPSKGGMPLSEGSDVKPLPGNGQR